MRESTKQPSICSGRMPCYAMPWPRLDMRPCVCCETIRKKQPDQNSRLGIYPSTARLSTALQVLCSKAMRMLQPVNGGIELAVS